jgi:hypothetical protein
MGSDQMGEMKASRVAGRQVGEARRLMYRALMVRHLFVSPFVDVAFVGPGAEGGGRGRSSNPTASVAGARVGTDQP